MADIEKLKAAKLDIKRNFLAFDGSMQLRPNRHGVDSFGYADNDNQVLWNALYLYILKEQDLLEPEDIALVLKSIESQKIEEGLYMKRAKHPTFLQSHDNLIALVAISVLAETFNPFDHKSIRRDIFGYGIRHGFVYDNTDTSKYSFRALLKFPAVAFLHLSNNAPARLFDFLFLIIATVQASLVSKHNGTFHWLNWLMLKSLETTAKRDIRGRGLNHQWQYSLVLKVLIPLWKQALLFKTGGKGMHWILSTQLERGTHPLGPLSEGMKY